MHIAQEAVWTDNGSFSLSVHPADSEMSDSRIWYKSHRQYVCEAVCGVHGCLPNHLALSASFLKQYLSCSMRKMIFVIRLRTRLVQLIWKFTSGIRRFLYSQNTIFRQSRKQSEVWKNTDLLGNLYYIFTRKSLYKSRRQADSWQTLSKSLSVPRQTPDRSVHICSTIWIV